MDSDGRGFLCIGHIRRSVNTEVVYESDKFLQVETINITCFQC